MSAEKPFPGTLSSVKGSSSKCLQTSLGSLQILPSFPGLICSRRLDTSNPWAGQEATAPNELENSLTTTIRDIIRCSQAHEKLKKETSHLPTHLSYHNMAFLCPVQSLPPSDHLSIPS